MSLTWLISAWPPGDTWNRWTGIQDLSGWIGTFLPFAAFAGGVAAYPMSRKHLFLWSLLVAVLSFGLLAYAEPLARFQARLQGGLDAPQQFPLGPETPGTLLALKERVEASPPETYRFSVDSPLQNPPNWLAFLFHSLFVLPVFALLAALLGWQSAALTTGLSPPARGNARWALGLLSGLIFFVAFRIGSAWVRGGLDHAGIIGAWAPLLVSILELLLLTLVSWVFQRRENGLLVSREP